ncbi:hypothetical protein CHH28_12495 [Bacterioplanes sanyensis]|uniref:DUF349 domain-containing protein n=1 Tax=Bacterioplanes sanyensis TaxID=1249553 RepID=A0A222FL95_9GAMM|nr:DUF349 domain-containing protein [Bacterioplanes sanyensis]ASP39442.1 hypothetical protein CHH28_12495 [Bacterioplanes sanyensis]
MALLKKFFKPKWQHDNPEVRRQALSDLQDEATLVSFIERESHTELRLQAVQKIRSTSVLQQLAQHKHDDVRSSARQQWLQVLLPEQGIDGVQDNQQLVQIAALTDDQQLRLAAISRITDQQERLQLAQTHPVAKVRLAAAEGIVDADKLQTLQQYAQGRDKAVYRLCKDRLAHARAEQEQLQAQQQQLQQFQEQLSYLNRLGYQPDFYARLQVLLKDWLTLRALASDDQQQSIDAALQQAQATLDAHQQEEQRRQQQQAQQQAAAEQQAQLLEQLHTLLQPSELTTEALEQALKPLQQQWDEAYSQHKPAASDIRAFENGQQILLTQLATLQTLEQQQAELSAWLQTDSSGSEQRLKQQLQQGRRWQQQLSWPGDHKPQWWQALHDKLEQLDAQLQQLKNTEQQRRADIDRQLDVLQDNLQRGHSKEANKLLSKLQQLIQKGAPAEQQRRLRSLAAQLHDMRDWQGFATTPKKEALVAQMQALVGADIAPDVLADKIQQLQTEWKQLAGGQSDQALWDQFQAAGDQAFEPCREYFAQRAQQREQFVEARRQLIAELNHYANNMEWQQADWKAVQKTLDVARQTFQQYSPVDRAAHKATQAEFRQACDAIQQPLQQHYHSNLQQKRALVDTAQALLTSDDLPAAIEQAKALQQQWKQVGMTPRREDQKLWKQFRQHCDALFARLDEQRQARKAGIDEAVSKAEALVAQAQSLQETQRSELAELTAQFNTIELPRGAHQRLQQRLKDIEQRQQQAQQQAHKAAELARWQGLCDKLQALHQGNEPLWQDAQLPSGCDAQLFEQAWQQLLTADQDAQELCIRMEILANIDSPTADQATRMAVQVQRLADGLGKGLSRDDERLQLVHLWLKATASDELLQRFISALKASI